MGTILSVPVQLCNRSDENARQDNARSENTGSTNFKGIKLQYCIFHPCNLVTLHHCSCISSRPYNRLWDLWRKLHTHV